MQGGQEIVSMWLSVVCDTCSHTHTESTYHRGRLPSEPVMMAVHRLRRGMSPLSTDRMSEVAYDITGSARFISTVSAMSSALWPTE